LAWIRPRIRGEQHYLHAANRARYGITDGPAYRDLDGPGAALFHISVEDMDTAMGWFRATPSRKRPGWPR